MKKLSLLLSFLFFVPAISFAAIPIVDQDVQTIPEKLVVEKDNDKLTDEPIKEKVKRKKNIIQKALDGLKGGRSSDKATFNTLSFIGAMLLIVLTIVGGGIIAFPIAIASLILGIMGLRKGERLQGLGIAGVIISSSFILLFALALAIIIALFGGL